MSDAANEDLALDARILTALREARDERLGPRSAQWIAHRLGDEVSTMKIGGRLRRLDKLGLVGQDGPGYQQSGSTWWYISDLA